MVLVLLHSDLLTHQKKCQPRVVRSSLVMDLWIKSNWSEVGQADRKSLAVTQYWWNWEISVTSSSSPSSLSLGIETVLGFDTLLFQPSIHPLEVKKRHSDILSRKIDFQRVVVGGGDAPRNRCHRKGISLVVAVCLSCSQRDSNGAFLSSDVWLARLNLNTSRERSTYAIHQSKDSFPTTTTSFIMCIFPPRDISELHDLLPCVLLSPWLLDFRDLPFHWKAPDFSSPPPSLRLFSVLTTILLQLTLESSAGWGNAAEEERDG